MDIIEKITSLAPELTNKQKIVGRYICENMYEASYMNVPQLAKASGISEATLTRFIYALGYSSFSSFQVDLRQSIRESKFAGAVSQEDFGDETNSVYKRVFDSELALMQETLQLIDPDIFNACISVLCKAHSILVIGGSIHSYLAEYAQSYISIFRDNVDIVNSLDINFLTRFRNISADTVALVFSYPRYPSEMQKIIEALYEKKIDIIGLTNSQMSPIVPFCKYVLITPQKYLVPTEPIASVVTMIHALTVGIYKADPIGAMKKLKQYEQAVASNAVFELKNYNFAQQL